MGLALTIGLGVIGFFLLLNFVTSIVDRSGELYNVTMLKWTGDMEFSLAKGAELGAIYLVVSLIVTSVVAIIYQLVGFNYDHVVQLRLFLDILPCTFTVYCLFKKKFAFAGGFFLVNQFLIRLLHLI